MNRIKHLLFVAAMLLLVGCNKDVNVNLSENAHDFETVGGTAEIGVESNGAWQVSGCPDWLTVSPMSGDGNATLTLTCANNTSGAPRSAELKVKTKTDEAVLAVRQGSATENLITFTPSTVSCDFLGGDFSVRVEANCDWSIGTLPAWIHSEPMSGSHSANIVLTIDRYTFSSESNRQYNVDFVAGEQHFYLPVTQENDQAYHVIPTPNTLVFGADGGTQAVALQSTIPWTLECTEDWVTATPRSGDGDGEILVTVAPNPSYVARVARVMITSSVGCVSSVFLTQEALVNPHYLVVDPSQLVFQSEESSLDFTISCDSLWTVWSSESWASVSENTGTGDGTVTVTVAAHNLLGNRYAQIVVVSGSLTRNVAVIQVSGSSEPLLSISPDLLQFGSEHSSGVASISANVAWTLQLSEPWIITEHLQGLGDYEVTIEAKENLGQESRSAMAILCFQGVPYDTLTIEQEGRVYYLEASVTELNASSQGDTFLVSVTSNQGWSLASNASWVHFDPSQGYGDNTFHIIVDANNSPSVRTAEVRLSGEVTGLVSIIINQAN